MPSHLQKSRKSVMVWGLVRHTHGPLRVRAALAPPRRAALRGEQSVEVVKCWGCGVDALRAWTRPSRAAGIAAVGLRWAPNTACAQAAGWPPRVWHGRTAQRQGRTGGTAATRARPSCSPGTCTRISQWSCPSRPMRATARRRCPIRPTRGPTGPAWAVCAAAAAAGRRSGEHIGRSAPQNDILLASARARARCMTIRLKRRSTVKLCFLGTCSGGTSE